jgi:hypothetical protein
LAGPIAAIGRGFLWLSWATDRHTGFRELIMNAKKIAGWAVVIFLAWYLITNPTGAAHAMTSLMHFLKQVGNSIATFFNSL